MKRIFNIKVVILSLLAIACNNDNINTQEVSSSITKKTEKKSIISPFKKVKLKPSLFIVNTAKPDTLRLGSGTVIYLPENVFVDSLGKIVQGDVRIEYKEFHNPAEIIISGIPMAWNNAGTKVDFETAGMMEIRAFQNNNQLEVARGKSIRVDMVSNRDENNFGTYYYDEAQNNWSCLNASGGEVAENTEKIKLLKGSEIEEQFNVIAPKAYDPQAYTFDLDINYSRFPELKDLNGVMWQYAGKSESQDPRSLPDFKNKKWINIELDRIPQNKEEFKLTLTDSKRKIFETVVIPVLSGKMLEKAQKLFAKKFELYQQKLAFKKAEKERLEKQANLLRTFSVQNMGIYNYDRQLKLEDRIELFADFDFDNAAVKDINMVEVFLITGNESAVVHYPKYDWELFAFSPKSDNKMIAILPNDKIAVFTQKDFNKLNVLEFKKNARTAFKFKMKVLDETVESPEQLNKILGRI